MLSDTANEVHVPARTYVEDIIPAISWEPVQDNAKYINQPQGHPEIGDGREKRQQWGYSRIVPGATLPGDQYTYQCTDEKTQDKSNSDQANGPGKALFEYISDRRGK